MTLNTSPRNDGLKLRATVFASDAPLLERLRERFHYLRQRKWVRLLIFIVIIVLAVWTFFYFRSSLPRTPAQQLDLQVEVAQMRLQVNDALIKLELVKAMIIARREPSSIEGYRARIADDLQTVFKHSPRALRKQWPPLERDLNALQTAINAGGEDTLEHLAVIEEKLHNLTYSSVQ
ncbi:MAG: hypothetical protein ACRCYY_03555 [Trueperaceae bacterium]